MVWEQAVGREGEGGGDSVHINNKSRMEEKGEEEEELQ